MSGRRSAAGRGVQVVLLEYCEEVKLLLRLLDDYCGVFSPGYVRGDEDTEEPEGVDPLHTLAIVVEWGWVGVEPPEVDDDLLGFADVQSQVVF